MRSANKLKRHRGGTFSGVEVTARGTKTTSAPEWRNHKVRTMFANVKSIPPFVVAAMNHFIHIFNHGISNFNVRIKKLVKML